MSEVSKLFNDRSKTYDEIYSAISSKKLLHQEKRVRSALVEEMISNELNLSDEHHIIDVGCGTGNFLLRIREKGIKSPLLGVDISPEMIDKARSNLQHSAFKDVEFRAGSTSDINNRANLVLSLGVSGYSENQNKFLEDLADIVDKGGYLIFTTANGDSISRNLRRFLSKLHSLLKSKTKSRGVEFQPIKEKTVDSLILNKKFSLEKRVYITFGLGLSRSSFECYVDRLLFSILKNNFLSKFLSLTTIHVYRKAS
tara:strand:- start:5678 stop:6442 length:765 start_codon:yes stop_codon:yes gene_type:complete